jgi:hypothetical protein
MDQKNNLVEDKMDQILKDMEKIEEILDHLE